MNEQQTYPDELLVKFLLQETNEKETAEVHRWLQEAETNRNYFEQLKSVWEESKSLQPTITLSQDESWLRLKSKLEKPVKLYSSKRYYYYAAAVIIFLLGLFFFINRKDKPSEHFAHHHPEKKKQDSLLISEKPIMVNLLHSKQGTRMDTLPDQSLVTLNRNSTLTCPKKFEGNERRVSLNGEAFFNITPDKSKPFFIDAGNDVEIKVVGTSFNVKSYTDFTEVIVETGIVEVRKFNRVVMLHPREKAKIRKSDSSIVVQKNTDKLYKYYRSKEFECDNLPLWRLVEVLNEAYGDSVVIGRKELRGLTLDTRFDNLSLENILELISETFDLKVEKQGNKYILK